MKRKVIILCTLLIVGCIASSTTGFVIGAVLFQPKYPVEKIKGVTVYSYKTRYQEVREKLEAEGHCFIDQPPKRKKK